MPRDQDILKVTAAISRACREDLAKFRAMQLKANLSSYALKRIFEIEQLVRRVDECAKDIRGYIGNCMLCTPSGDEFCRMNAAWFNDTINDFKADLKVRFDRVPELVKFLLEYHPKFVKDVCMNFSE